MIFQSRSLLAFLILSASPVANAQICYESGGVCLATMGTPGSCVSKTQGRTYAVCCPFGATQTWDATDVCEIGGENTELRGPLCYESGGFCLATMGTPGSCVSTTQSRTYAVCCPSGATGTWDATDVCEIGGENTELPTVQNRCTETWNSLCLATMTPSTCRSTWRTFDACCPIGATESWTPGTTCSPKGSDNSGGGNTGGLNKCTETSGSVCLANLSPSSCRASSGRTFDACCPSGATESWEPGTTCSPKGSKSTSNDSASDVTVADIGGDDSSAAPPSPSSAWTVMTALGMVATIAVAVAGF